MTGTGSLWGHIRLWVRALVVFPALVPGLLDAADKRTPPGEVLVYKETPTRTLRVGVLKPPGWSATDRRPAVVLMHGGGWYMRNLAQMEGPARYFAELGAVVFVADYRSTKGDKVKVGALLSDARSIIRFVRGNIETFGVDPDRVSAGGASSGGHLMVSTALIDDPAYDDPGDETSISCVPNFFIGFNPVMQRKEAKWSPADHVNKDSVPVVMCYGTADHNWLPTAQAYAKAAEEKGAVCELQLYEGGGHGFWRSKPRQVVNRMLPLIYEHGMLDVMIAGESGAPISLESLEEMLPGRSWNPMDGGTILKDSLITEEGPGLYRLRGRKEGAEDRVAYIQSYKLIDDQDGRITGEVSRKRITGQYTRAAPGTPMQIGEGVTEMTRADQRVHYEWKRVPPGTWRVEAFIPFQWNAHKQVRVKIEGGEDDLDVRTAYGNRPPGWEGVGVVTLKTEGSIEVTIYGPKGTSGRVKAVPADAVRFVPVVTGHEIGDPN